MEEAALTIAISPSTKGSGLGLRTLVGENEAQRTSETPPKVFRTESWASSLVPELGSAILET